MERRVLLVNRQTGLRKWEAGLLEEGGAGLLGREWPLARAELPRELEGIHSSRGFEDPIWDSCPGLGDLRVM